MNKLESSINLMCPFMDCGRKPEWLVKPRQGENMATLVSKADPSPVASGYDVTVLTTALCHPFLFSPLSVSFKHQIQFVFSPSADLMGFHTRLWKHTEAGTPRSVIQWFHTSLFAPHSYYSSEYTQPSTHCSSLTLICVTTCLSVLVGKASPELLNRKAHESISMFPSTHEKDRRTRTHSSVPSRTQFPQRRREAWHSHWLSPRSNIPTQSKRTKKEIRFQTVLANKTSVFMWKNWNKLAKVGWRAVEELNCQEVKCRIFLAGLKRGIFN